MINQNQNVQRNMIHDGEVYESNRNPMGQKVENTFHHFLVK